MVTPLLAVANSEDIDAAKEAVAKLSDMGHHPVELAVYNRQKIFRKDDFKFRQHVLCCWMHSFKEVALCTCFFSSL